MSQLNGKPSARTQRRVNQSKAAAAVEQIGAECDFDQLANEQLAQIDHMTIPGFLRRIPHKWHLDEITRFGDKVGRAADAMQLSYLTSIDRSLGVIRVFPLPLLQRIYAIMSPQFGWPTIIEHEALEDGRRAQREALKKLERTEQGLDEIMQRADNVDVLASFQAAREFIHATAQKLRLELQGGEPQEAAANT
jgi:hypothetical protein